MQQHAGEEEPQPPLGETEDDGFQAAIRQLLHKALQIPLLGELLVLIGIIIAVNILIYIFQNPLAFWVLVGLGIGLFMLRRYERNMAFDQGQQQYTENKRLSPEEILEELHQISPPEFEQVVEVIMQRKGYQQVQRVGGSGDLCVDVQALNRRGEKTVVQCKRYAAMRKVSSKEMQQFIGMASVEHKAKWGIYVTTSSYTKDARNLGEKHGIELIDGVKLVKILHDIAPKL